MDAIVKDMEVAKEALAAKAHTKAALEDVHKKAEFANTLDESKKLAAKVSTTHPSCPRSLSLCFHIRSAHCSSGVSLHRSSTCSKRQATRPKPLPSPIS